MITCSLSARSADSLEWLHACEGLWSRLRRPKEFVGSMSDVHMPIKNVNDLLGNGRALHASHCTLWRRLQDVLVRRKALHDISCLVAMLSISSSSSGDDVNVDRDFSSESLNMLVDCRIAREY